MTVPAAAVQVSQAGTFVFVVKDDVAQRPPGQGRAHGRRRDRCIESGLEGGETVVTDGQLLLRTARGSRSAPADGKAGS